MNDNLTLLIHLFAKKNQINLDKSESEIQLLSHPHYPSLNCISDLFNHFNIENLALRVETTQQTFDAIPHTFMAQLELDGGTPLAVVTKGKGKGKGKVDLVYGEKKSTTMNIDKFLDSWNGILFVIEKSEFELPEVSVSKVPFKRILTITSLFSVVSLFFVLRPTLFQGLHFVLSGIGIYISTLLIQQELGVHSKILDAFCSGENKKTDYDAVLDSKGATIFGLFKLSDMSLVYFGGLFVSMFLMTMNNLTTIHVLLHLAILTLPLTMLSIHYQFKVVKSWCPLCLTLIGVLWIQFGILFFDASIFSNFLIFDVSYIYFGVSFLLIVLFWSLVRPLLRTEKEFKKLEIEHIKFKRNFNLFKAALNLNPFLETTTKIFGEIMLGNKNPDALLKMILVTNPMCGFCKDSHQVIDKILEGNNENIQVIIRFNVRAEDTDSTGTKIALKLVELYNTTNEKTCLNALSDIYGTMEASTWLNKWGELLNDEFRGTLTEEKEWCTENNLNFTPALILNGYQFPRSEYNYDDINYFIDDLIEEQETKNVSLELESTI